LKFIARNNRTMTQSALRYALLNEHIAVVLVGAKTVEQIEENLRASEAPVFSPDELQDIAALQQNGFKK
jgi:aryl-alcohol dehydrogenase-like predicted oxidoreductase